MSTTTTILLIAGFIVFVALFFLTEGFKYFRGKLNIFNRFSINNPEYTEAEPGEQEWPDMTEPAPTRPRSKDVWKHWMKR